MFHQIGITFYYMSYLIFPFMVYLTYFYFWRNKSFLIIFFFLLGAIFIRMRFIEPNFIKVSHSKIESNIDLKIALIADLHLGSFKNKFFLSRVVNKINKQDIDVLLIAGDLTYCSSTDCDLEKMFTPLKDINVPIYAVLGNHDVEKPGPNIRNNLESIMKKIGVHLLNNDIIEFKNYTLIGLGSTFNDEDNTEIIDNFSSGNNLIVLAHNPDVIGKYQTVIPEITFAGHTHGCQIKIPFCKYIIPTKLVSKDGNLTYIDKTYKYSPVKGKFSEGLYHTKNGKIFVTSGLGEVGLPLRFFNIPTIDIVYLGKTKK